MGKFTHVCISICQNIQGSDEGWWLIPWESLPMYVFLFVRIFKHLMKAGG